jgi:hypothetical protein
MSAFVPWTGHNFKSDLVPVKEQRRKAKRTRMKPDRDSNEIVKERSGGRCEATLKVWGQGGDIISWIGRCQRKAVHIHHKLGGHGVRGRGPSALAENKLHLCLSCHLKAHAAKRHNTVAVERE